jgi:heme-degrading monooxygenase HmoA
MIARIWRGWTNAEDADAYEHLLREVVYPGLKTIAGYCGGYVLRQDRGSETEFVTVNLFESLDAVKAFAGPDYEAPVFEPEARRLLPLLSQSRATTTKAWSCRIERLSDKCRWQDRR